MWTQAGMIAAGTPDSRNRAIDFLRAISLCVVTLGHWLIAAPYMSEGQASFGHLLTEVEWTRYLTWLLQVMPIFFFVGGWSNATTWVAARNSSVPFAAWLHMRVRRLLVPVLVLLIFWVGVAVVATFSGLHPAALEIASQTALLPVWFLAIYLLVVALVPLTYSAWRRWGMATIWLPIALASFVDVLFFGTSWTLFGWSNYLFVWGAVHQLGYAWKDKRLSTAKLQALCAGGGGLALIVLLKLIDGPWPISLVGVPGEVVSNTTPPHIPLLALAAFQFGIIRLCEAPLNRWLAKPFPWTATVMLGASAMTLYLWHSTSMMFLIGGAFWAGGIGLTWETGTLAWWGSRLLWIPSFFVMFLPFLAIFGKFERPAPAGVLPPSVFRQVLGLLFICGGLAFLARGGVTGTGFLGVPGLHLSLAFVGIWMATATDGPFSGNSR